MELLVDSLYLWFGIIFAIFGVRNLRWTVAQEREKFRRLVSLGLQRVVTETSIRSGLFGLLLFYTAQYVPNAIFWKALGILVVALGVIGLGIAWISNLGTPTIEQMPEGSRLDRKVDAKNRLGLVLLLVGAVWLWNGYPVLST